MFAPFHQAKIHQFGQAMTNYILRINNVIDIIDIVNLFNYIFFINFNYISIKIDFVVMILLI